MVDPYGNIMFKNKNNDLLSITDIVSDYNDSFAFSIIDDSDFNITNMPNYLEKDSQGLNVYKNQKLIVLISSKYLYWFHKNTKDIYKILKSILGKPSVAIGLQYLKKDSKKVGNFGINLYKIFITSEGN